MIACLDITNEIKINENTIKINGYKLIIPNFYNGDYKRMLTRLLNRLESNFRYIKNEKNNLIIGMNFSPIKEEKSVKKMVEEIISIKGEIKVILDEIDIKEYDLIMEC